MKEFIKSLFSLDEEKSSIVVICFVMFSLMSLWKFFKYGDIPSNAMTVILSLAGIISGSNVINKYSDNQKPKV